MFTENCWTLKDELARLRQTVAKCQTGGTVESEADAWLRVLIHTIPDLICFKDVEGRYLLVNKAFEKWAGLNQSEILGKTDNQIHPPNIAKYCKQGDNEVLNHRKTIRFEDKVALSDGKEILFDTVKTPLYDNNGSIVGVVDIRHDITYRKEMEKVLQEAMEDSEFRFRNVFDHAPIGMALVSNDKKFIRVNRAFCEIVGYTEEELSGMTFQDITHPDDREIGSLLSRKLVNGEIDRFELEKRYIHKDGHIIWGQLNVSMVCDRKGRPAYGVSKLQDITRRKEMEIALQESEERYRRIVENIDEIIYIVRTEDNLYSGKVEFVSSKVSAIVGYQPEEFLEDPGLWVRSVHPEDMNVIKETTRKIVDSKTPGTRVYRFLHKKTGVYRWMEDRVIPLRNEEGKVYGLFGVARDITERKYLEEQLAHSQKMEAIGRLAGGVAHDFNNLLTAILGYAELLRQRLTPEDPSNHYVDEIWKAAERGAMVTDQLLSFTRRKISDFTTLNLNEVIRNIDGILRRLIGEDIEFVVTLGEDLALIKADKIQIEQLLMNLVINSRDAMPQGGTLSIKTQDVNLNEAYTNHYIDLNPGPYVMLEVSDTGTGMDRETQSHIFEPFFTTKEVGKGTGLGLFTVYSTVTRSRGHMEVKSEPGKGSTFRIFFPQATVPTAGTRKHSITLRETPPGYETILVVEDDTHVLELIREALLRNGYKVIYAYNGDEALQIARGYTGPIDLLISDVVMPRISGPELVQQIKSLRPDIKVLFTSGYTCSTSVHKRIQEDNIPLLQKPFTLHALAQKVREVLDRE